MISNDPGGERQSSVVRLSSDDFKVIFQVTKELHSLPAGRLAGIGYSAGQGDELLAALRNIRMQVRDASVVEISFTDPDGGEVSLPTAVAQSGSDADDRQAANVRLAIPWATASRWQALTTAIVLALGERELFLRTGYRVDEVRDSTRSLAALSQQ